MKIRPNDLCPCGSGKKYKKCHNSATLTLGNQLNVSNLLSQALTLQTKNQLSDAEKYIQQAIKQEPTNLEAWQALGNLAEQAGDYESAKECYLHILHINPKYSAAYFYIGNLFYKKSEFLDARNAYLQAIELDPDVSEVWSNLGNVEKYLGNFKEAIQCYYRGVTLQNDITQKYRQHSNLLFSMHYDKSLTPEDIFNAHLEWANNYASQYYPECHFWPNATLPNRKLRIGYLSGSFNSQIVGHFFENVLLAHNKDNYEIILYSSTANKDATTSRLAKYCEKWVDINHLDDINSAKSIQEDRIDILVDLDGHTPNGRPLVFARKPSPIQVEWLDYFDTTGMEVMDYIISDIYTTPLDSPQKYIETVYRLPQTRFCYTPLLNTPEITPPPCLSGGTFTFGSFNRQDKITPELINAWATILLNTTDSRLIIKNRALIVPAVKSALENKFQSYGIPSERIILRGPSPHFEMLKEYSEIDIALDTFPYNGGLTSCECLWMGVPIIAIEGERMIERQTSALLHLLELKDFIASSETDYINLAIEISLKQNQNKLENIRNNLRKKMLNSFLCDAKGFTNNLELAYRNMWKIYCDKINANQ